jgi:hypothetical protein
VEVEVVGTTVVEVVSMLLFGLKASEGTICHSPLSICQANIKQVPPPFS